MKHLSFSGGYKPFHFLEEDALQQQLVTEKTSHHHNRFEKDQVEDVTIYHKTSRSTEQSHIVKLNLPKRVEWSSLVHFYVEYSPVLLNGCKQHCWLPGHSCNYRTHLFWPTAPATSTQLLGREFSCDLVKMPCKGRWTGPSLGAFSVPQTQNLHLLSTCSGRARKSVVRSSQWLTSPSPVRDPGWSLLQMSPFK